MRQRLAEAERELAGAEECSAEAARAHEENTSELEAARADLETVQTELEAARAEVGAAETERDRHLQVLATLARTVGMDTSFQDRLFAATSPAHAAEILHGEDSERFNYFLE